MKVFNLKNDFLILLLGLISIAGLGFWGLPAPFADDLFYVGPAMHFVNTGHMANPLLAGWTMRAVTHFYFQPPFFFYALSFWLKLFGISAFALTSFQIVCHCLFMVYSFLILKKFCFPSWVFLAVLFIYVPVGFSVGLRHDVMGMMLLPAGLYLLSLKDIRADFAGGFLLAAAPLTWPITAAYALPLGLYLVLTRNEFLQRKDILKCNLSLILGAGTAIFLASALIHFHVNDFLRDFLWHTQVRKIPLAELPHFLKGVLFRDPVSFVRFSCAFMIMMSMARLGMNLRVSRVGRMGILAALSSLLLSILIYSAPIYSLWLLAVQIYGLVCFLHLSSRGMFFLRAVLGFSLSVLAAINLILFILYNFFTGPGNVDAYPAIRQIAAQAVSSGKTIVVDDASARYVFDYHLPEDSRALIYLNGPPTPYPTTLSERKPDQVWIISKGYMAPFLKDLPAKKLQLFGRTFNSVYTEIKDIQIIGNPNE